MFFFNTLFGEYLHLLCLILLKLALAAGITWLASKVGAFPVEVITGLVSGIYGPQNEICWSYNQAVP